VGERVDEVANHGAAFLERVVALVELCEQTSLRECVRRLLCESVRQAKHFSEAAFASAQHEDHAEATIAVDDRQREGRRRAEVVEHESAESVRTCDGADRAAVQRALNHRCDFRAGPRFIDVDLGGRAARDERQSGRPIGEHETRAITVEQRG
jgi:hypothetical protein